MDAIGNGIGRLQPYAQPHLYQHHKSITDQHQITLTNFKQHQQPEPYLLQYAVTHI